MKRNSSPFALSALLKIRSLRLAVLTLLLLLITHHSLLITARAQSATATLSGTVIDQNGAVVPGVAITIINQGTGLQWQGTSNEEGYFTIPLLPPGAFTVRAQRDGFATLQLSVTLNVGDQKALKIQLKTGDLKETVVISGEAPLINESPAVGTVVDRQFVSNLPLNGRSFQSLIALTPGVTLTKANASNPGQFSVNGQRANANYFTIDGVSANFGSTVGTGLSQSGGGALPGLTSVGSTNNLISVDALQEFKIQTSTYSPEFGRQPGGQVSIVTRSGTNDFHGALFEYFRNDALDANDWFNNRLGLKKSALRQNDFGVLLGGPILLPRFGEGGSQPGYDGHNRTFFFFSYEGLRLRVPLTLTSVVPSVASRQDPRASDAVRQLLNVYPVPNGRDLGNGFAEFTGAVSDPSNLDATSIRVDHTVNQNLTLFGRYSYAPSTSLLHGIFGGVINNVGLTKSDIQTLTLGSTQIVRTSTTNEFRVNYSQNRATSNLKLDNIGGAIPPPDSLIFPSFASVQDSAFTFQLTGLPNFQIGLNAINTQRQFNLVDNVSAIEGTHQLKFGVDYRRIFPINSPVNYFQRVTYGGLTGSTGALTGIPSSVVVGAFETNTLVMSNFSVYGQDTWKASPRLTITYGLRWEVNTPPKSSSGIDPFTVQGLDNPANMTLAPPGTPLYKTTYNNFAPRVGGAYQLSQRQGRETVLRGGFGVFYDLGLGTIASAAVSFPYNRSRILTNVPYPLTPAQAVRPGVNTTPSATTPVGFINVAEPNLKLPRTLQWNLAIEQSLGANQTLTASYVGAASRRLLRQERFSNPNPIFQVVDVIRSDATSDYHAMQLQFQRRLSRGLQVLTSYTWSHSIDTVSSDSNIFPLGQRIDPRTGRGPSDFDVRHVFSTALSYNIPSFALGNIGNAIVHDWSVDTIVRVQTANPVNITYTAPGSFGFGSVALRPDLLSGVPLYINDPLAAGGKRINRAAFLIPTQARQGTLGRNALRGFPVSQVDLALRRLFKLTERFSLQFGAEFFNIFNHPNFADPISVLTNPLFGQSTQMLGRSLGSGGTGGLSPLYQIGGPRSIQLTLKLRW